MPVPESSSPDTESHRQRTIWLFEEHQRAICETSDRLFAGLMLFQWLAAVVAAATLGPWAWGDRVSLHQANLGAAFFLGGAMTLIPVYLAQSRPGHLLTRHTIAVGQMLMAGLLNHISRGHTETNFHVFGSLAFLAFYRDWRVLVSATGVVILDHLVRGLYWPESVFGIREVSLWRTFELTSWMVFADVFLIRASLRSRSETWAIHERQALLEDINRDIEGKVRSRTVELKASEERFRSLSASSPIGIFQTDVRGRCLYTNDPWNAISGLSPAESTERSWLEILHLEDRDLLEDTWPDLAARGGGGELLQECRILTPRSELRWAQARLKPLRSEAGEITGYVGTLQDITEQKRIQQELLDKATDLARANQALTKKNAELDEFTYFASHDLQEPLRKLASFSTLLKQDLPGDMPQRAATDLAFIMDASARMRILVLKLLSLSRAGQAAMRWETVSLDECADRAIEELALRVEETGARITRDPLPTVWGDRTMLTQLYQNLISNALKFVGHQESKVHLSVQTEDGGVVLGVVDNGIGLRPEYGDKIFKPFKRLHGRSKFEGAGIGLSICKKTVERHGGSIWVESAPGQGAHFKFTIASRSPVAEGSLDGTSRRTAQGRPSRGG